MQLGKTPRDIIVEIVHIYLRDLNLDHAFFSEPRQCFKALLSLLHVNYGLALVVVENLLTYHRTILLAISGSEYHLDRLVPRSNGKVTEEHLNKVNMVELNAKIWISSDLSGRDTFRSLFGVSARFRLLWSDLVASRTSHLSGFHFKLAISNGIGHLPCDTTSMATPFLSKNTTRMLDFSNCQTLS